MAQRTTEEKVRAIIDNDKDINVEAFIDQAVAVTDYVELQDTQDLLSAPILEVIERNLAAHFYAHRDQQYQSKATGGASATFQGQTGMGFDSTYWGQTAKRLDVTGCLSSMDKGKTPVGVHWLGKPLSDQLDYDERN